MPETPAPASLLAVEDDEVMRRAIARATEGVATVRFAHDGAEALRALGGGPLPSFVLLDFLLPDMDGLQVLRLLREKPPTEALPVVVFSSLRDPKRIRAVLLAGANSWVGKPDDPDGFRDAVQSICRYWTRLNRVA